MKVLIRGAGDLATGIAYRLYQSGYQILMTEIEVPLTVRRSVAFSRAVYEYEAIVEDVKAVLVPTVSDAQYAIAKKQIPVMIDPNAECRKTWKPDVIVDAILAKRNLGTTIEDAPLVIGVGPGFTAGSDCHYVVETKRGHDLGRVISVGSAIPNTGVPGEVGGYSIERLIKATASGVMEPKASIGDMVEKGQIVAHTGGQPVYALMPGIVRGMLQSGVQVTKGLKIGDIDARCEKRHCDTISDKARAIGGGVLEAIGRSYPGQYGIVVLAAGDSRRFGGNKLMQEYAGKKMYEHMLELLQAFPDEEKVVVTQYDEIIENAKKRRIDSVRNQHPQWGISHSLQLGMEHLLGNNPGIRGILFTVCDQPTLSERTIGRLLDTARNNTGKIICASDGCRAANPVVWDRCYFQELQTLQGDVGGKQLMRKYPEEILYLSVPAEELKDIDYKTDLE